DVPRHHQRRTTTLPCRAQPRAIARYAARGIRAALSIARRRLVARSVSDAGENFDRIAHIEVERNEELQRLAILLFRESNRDLRGPVGNGFHTEKPPLSLISQRKAKSPKL